MKIAETNTDIENLYESYYDVLYLLVHAQKLEGTIDDIVRHSHVDLHSDLKSQ